MPEVSEETLDELYAGAPEDFVAARDAAAGRAREAGDRALARALSALRRPTVGAWLVNLLVRRQPELIDELFALGDQLRQAQQGTAGGAVRELVTQRRAVVSALARQAQSLAAAAGRTGTLPLAEVEQTLMAALGDPVAADEVRTGMLTHPLTPGGFAGEAGRPALTVIRGGKAEPKKPAHLAQPPVDSALAARVGEAEAALQEAAQAAAEAVQRHDEASGVAAELEERVADAQSAVDEAERVLSDRRAELAEAQAKFKAASKELADHAHAVGKAHLAEVSATRELAAARAAAERRRG
jgi:hypothetical protein